MIYHFTIRGEGEPFLAAAAQFERRYRIPISTVISTRHSRQEPLRRAARAIRRTLPTLPGPTHRLGPHHEIANVNSDAFRRRIRPGDVGISTIFDQIFDQATIGCFQELVNIHPSLLPLYRGPDPLYWVLANGESTSGVTLHEITPRIDAGPIRFQERVDIAQVHTRTELRRLMVSRSIPIFVRYLEHIALGAGFPQRIEDAAATYRVHLDYAHDPKRPRRRAG